MVKFNVISAFLIYYDQPTTTTVTCGLNDTNVNDTGTVETASHIFTSFLNMKPTIIHSLK